MLPYKVERYQLVSFGNLVHIAVHSGGQNLQKLLIFLLLNQYEPL